MTDQNQYKRFILRGKAVIFIDWANVHGWKNSLKREVNIEKLFVYLKSYPEIMDIRLYFWEDEHPKSKEFLEKAREIGYAVTSKPVKYIPVAEVNGKKIFRRKCDFDMEVCIDVHAILAKKTEIQSFIFFTGDGDYEPLYKMLIGLRKQVIVVYAHGHLGREIYRISMGIYKKPVDTLGDVFVPK